MSLTICICTHNPDLESLHCTLRSVRRQTAAYSEVLLIDNACDVGLSEAFLEPFRLNGIDSRLVSEPKLGISHARIKAIRETATDWILFVDDDNELFDDYVEQGMAFIQKNPNVGCFGGRLLLPSSNRPPNWVKSYLPWLGIKDGGDDIIINDSIDGWGIWEPPGAGCWVHRDVLEEYTRGIASDSRRLELGRCGRNGLRSCEDSLMMRGAYKVRRANAYVPTLKLIHHLNERKFDLGYLLRLMKSYGESHMILDFVLKVRPSAFGYPKTTIAFYSWLVIQFMGLIPVAGWRYALGKAIYHQSARQSFGSLSRSATDLIANENQHCNSLS